MKHFLINQREHMRPPEAARYIGLSVSTLAKLRMLNKRPDGPNYSKINGSVIYRRNDLDAWIDKHMAVAEDTKTGD